jgi:hypothetical protein
MQLETLLPGMIGAFVGVVGWLFVGIYIQRRQFLRQARNAARAVFFEIDVNRVALSVARDFASYAPLDRTAFERLLPELATLLPAAELKTIVAAYMTHAGYRQLSSEGKDLPVEVRTRALDGIITAHERALETLGQRAFSAREARTLAAPDAAVASGRTSAKAESERKPVT